MVRSEWLDCSCEHFEGLESFAVGGGVGFEPSIDPCLSPGSAWRFGQPCEFMHDNTCRRERCEGSWR